MLILGKKGANLGQKGPKKGGAISFRTVHINFPKEDNKISFYTKNQQNLINHSEDINQNVDFGPKSGKFGPKWAGTKFLRTVNFNFRKEDH